MVAGNVANLQKNSVMYTYWNAADMQLCGETLLPLLVSWFIALVACLSWVRSA